VGQSDFHYFSLAMDFPNDEASYKITPMASSDADAYRAAVLVATDRKDDAQKLIDSVLAADPKNALAYESEGMLRLRDHDLDAARKAYAEAAALHSTSFLAWYNAAALTRRTGERDDTSIEADLEQCLKLNPDFAPANNALADYYASRHENLDQALTLSILAVTEEPDNIEYRINNASLHMQRNEIPSAIAVLEAARPFARTPQEVAILNARVEQIKHYQDQLAAAAANPAPAAATSTAVSGATTVTTVAVDDDPHYPDAPPSGPHHIATGILHNVQCAYPTILTLTVDGGAKPVALYTNHMYKIDYWVSFEPKGGLDPCKMEGMKGVVTYTAVKDSRVAGQIVSIKVSK
jgi:tetratricopeptide (TPR) repeat protein